MTQRDIAHRRGISLSAVKYHTRNIREKLGLRGRTELREWFAAPSDSALANAASEVSAMTTLGPLGQISRTVGDIEASRAWYADVLRLPHLYTFGNLSFFDCAGTRLMLTSEHGARADESILYFRVTDIRSAHVQLSERGAQFVSPPHMIHRHADGTEEWLAFFKDPDDRPLALISQTRVES
jgi:catechol 2,3-dioxygenase-like lactoylglutathione lyase family enzyme